MKKSTQTAIGGVSAALCLVLLFLTGLIPFSTYIFPATAGILLAVVARENGVKTAFLVYIATGVLGAFLIPDRQAVIMFIMLLGYYPMIRPYFFRYPNWISYICRMAVMNLAVVLFYWVIKFLLGFEENILDTLKYGIYALWVLAVFTMVLYDYLLGRLAFIYEYILRKRFLRRLGN